jgi:hypothetical protein
MTNNSENSKKYEAPGQNRVFTIFVNSREKKFEGKEINFVQVIELAFGSYDTNPDVVYTVTFSKGHDDKKDGTLVYNQSVQVKEGMNFNVRRANKS